MFDHCIDFSTINQSEFTKFMIVVVVWISQVTAGNINCYDVVKNSVPAIYARYIRLYPITWYIRGCVRMELYGEPWPEGDTYIHTKM